MLTIITIINVQGSAAYYVTQQKEKKQPKYVSCIVWFLSGIIHRFLNKLEISMEEVHKSHLNEIKLICARVFSNKSYISV